MTAFLAQNSLSDQNLRPITIDDYFKIKTISNPQFSPNGIYVAYEVKIASLEKNKNITHVNLFSLKNQSTTSIFSTDSNETSTSHPLWNPNNQDLAYFSEDKKKLTQIWIYNISSNHKTQLTHLTQDVDDFAWSPDGTRLVLVLHDSNPDSDSGKNTKVSKPLVIDRLQFIKEGVGYLDHRRTHLYVFDLKNKSITQITSGDYDDSEPSWSPDGKYIAFTSNRAKPDPDASYNSNIWVVSADNKDKGQTLSRISTSVGANASSSWSFDGKWITYTTQLDPHLMSYGTVHLGLYNVSDKTTRVLTLKLDRSVNNPQFSADNKYIYFIVGNDGTKGLYKVSVDGNTIFPVINGRQKVGGFSLDKEGDVAIQITTIKHPAEIYELPAGHSKLIRLTHINDSLMSQLKLSDAEYIHFASKDDTQIAGYLYKPLNYVPSKHYPTILFLHGGPVSSYDAEFDHMAQLFAANGYIVLYPNPRGSSGYGQNFSMAVRANRGSKDIDDDLAMVDFAIEKGISDPQKLGVGGRSYGGISTNFIITKTSRFKAAISGASDGLLLSMFGGDGWQNDYRTEYGLPWKNKDLWEKVSPFYNIENIHTPTLFMGGGKDLNVPVLGCEQMYLGSKMLGRPTELVIYPEERHVFTIPSNIKDRLERYFNWYDHYLKN